MSTQNPLNLLALLSRGKNDQNVNPWAAIPTTVPEATTAAPAVPQSPTPAAEVQEPTKPAASPSYAASGTPTPHDRPVVKTFHTENGQPARGERATPLPESFIPREPNSLGEAEVNEEFVVELAIKYLLSCACATGREVAEQVKLPFKLVDGLLRKMKTDQLVIYRNSAPMNDYEYQLTELGREKAKRLAEHCSYFGSAPVSLESYIASVAAQSLTRLNPTHKDLSAAFEDLLINKRMFGRLGPAINSGRGLFLYGAPGNGKTSIAERVTGAFGQYIWIPRAIGIDGEIMRVYDPCSHEPAPMPKSDDLLDQRKIDGRWIRIRRPTIIVGGELTMEQLEVSLNTSTKICEAPLQLKSNCGTLVIDDFGRQKMRTDELLNRWIVPLEKRFDYLNMPNGKKIQVPFDQLIIFSTNLEPRDLVDDAFLRRIPYKINVIDPTEQEFRELFMMMSPKLGFEYREDVIRYVIDRHYRSINRPFRCCQPRDLLMQIRNFCIYNQYPIEMTPAHFDFAVENYFAIM